MGQLGVLLILGISIIGLLAMVRAPGGPPYAEHAPYVYHPWGVAAPHRFPLYAPGPGSGSSGPPAILAAGALGAVALAGGATAAVACGRRRRSAAEWIATLSARFDAVREEYGRFQSDVLTILDRPALADCSVPQTAAFITAYGVTQDAARAARRTRSGQTRVAFDAAVRDLEAAWRIARDHAARVGTDAIPAAERSNVVRAVAALHLALADSGSPAERQVAYRVAVNRIERLIDLRGRQAPEPTSVTSRSRAEVSTTAPDGAQLRSAHGPII